MHKIAVFVEGQSEQIIIRDFLLKEFNWEVNVQCLRLYKKGLFQPAPYDYLNPSSSYSYTIYNVGNDVEVLNELLMYENNLWNEGYERIVGLRDMYSRRYRTFSSTINEEINQRFLSGHNKTIEQTAKKPKQIFFCFSIMEVETWILGIHEIFGLINANLTLELIKSNLGYDLTLINPETQFFQPAKNLDQILNLVNITYSKSAGDIEKICSCLNKAHFTMLYERATCNSFNKFKDVLIPQ